MARYIDADAFIKRIKQNEKWIMAGIQIKDQYGATKALHDCLDALKMFETADVKPIVRGEWGKNENRNTCEIYKCNLCGGIMCHKSNFCPDCGADMRGEEK